MSESAVLKEVTSRLRQICGSEEQVVPLHKPEFYGQEWEKVKDCLDTGWVSSVGQYVDTFEAKLSEFTGIPYAVAVMNGTAALHMALMLVDVQPNDEVLLPALTFVATANAVSYCRAYPHFVDSDPVTLGIDADKLDAYLEKVSEIREGQCVNRETCRPIKALIPMHTFGHPCKMEALSAIAERYHIQIIEDAAESLGSFYQERHTGHWGRCAAVSFNGNKIITTGGGGAILTHDEALAKRAKHLTTTAKEPHPWVFKHDAVGFNYRLPNINAALGCAQLEVLEKRISAKRALAQAYAHVFSDLEELSVVLEPAGAKSNYWLNALMLRESQASLLESLLEHTNQAGLMTRPIWALLCDAPMYQACPSMDLSQARSLSKRILNIPSSAYLGAPYV